MQKYVYQKYTSAPGEEDIDDLDSRLQSIAKDTVVCAILSHHHWIATEVPLEHNRNGRPMD